MRKNEKCRAPDTAAESVLADSNGPAGAESCESSRCAQLSWSEKELKDWISKSFRGDI